MKARMLIAISYLTVTACFADSRASANYTIRTETVNAAGGGSLSAAYANHGALGGFGGSSTAPSPVIDAKHGYIGQLQESGGVQPSANPSFVDEGGTRQLDAREVFEDGSSVAIAPGSVAWSVLSGPVVNVSAGGVATAGIVYQDTPAFIGGNYAGASSSFALNVRNIGLDDFETYAGDGIDDAWQVQYFGINNPAARRDQDPDGDGQNNVFEYVANVNPTNAASLFRLSISDIPNRPFKNIIFHPRFDTRSYTVQYRLDVGSGAFGPLGNTQTSDNGDERTVTDLDAADAARFYRVQISLP